MADYAKDVIEQVEAAGGKFWRMTGRGHRRYRLGATFIDVPTKGLDDGRMRANLLSQIKRAAKAVGPVKPKELKKHERPIAAVAPAQVAEEAAPSKLGGGREAAQGGSPRGGDHDDSTVPSDGRVGVVHRDEPPTGRAHPSEPVGRLEIGPSGTLETGLPCPDCGRRFDRPLHLGRHRQIVHGYRRDRPERTVKLTVEVPVALASSDVSARFIIAVNALVAVSRELADELRLLREENARLREGKS